jgi:hypothetical protein
VLPQAGIKHHHGSLGQGRIIQQPTVSRRKSSHSHSGRVHSHPLPKVGIRHKHGNLDFGKATKKKTKIIRKAIQDRPIPHYHNGRVHSHLLPKNGLDHAHGSLGVGKPIKNKIFTAMNSNIPEGQFRKGNIEISGFYDVISIKGNKITSYRRRFGERKFLSKTYLLQKKEIHILEQILTSIGAEKWKPFYNNHPELKVGHKWALNYKSRTLKIKSAGFHRTPPGYYKLFSYVFDTLTRNKDPIKPTYAIDGSFSMGGMGGSQSITLQNKKLIYTKFRRGEKAISRIYYLSNTDIYKLEKKLIEKETKTWVKIYNCRPRLMDGTSWSLKYKSKRLNIESSGSNCYPKHYKEVAHYLLEEIMKGKKKARGQQVLQ